MAPCSDSSFDKSMEILSENVNRHFSRYCILGVQSLFKYRMKRKSESMHSESHHDKSTAKNPQGSMSMLMSVPVS